MTRKSLARSKLLREVRELRRVVRLLAPYTSGQGRAIVAGIFLTVALLALRLAQPWPLKWILDGLVGDSPQPLAPVWAGVAFLVVSTLSGVAEYKQVVSLVGLGNQVLYRFRAELFGHALRLPLAYHERKQEGELLTRIVYDTTRLRKGVNRIITRFFQTLITFVATIAVLLWVDAFLAGVMAVGGALAIYLMGRSIKKVKKAADKNRRREGKLAGLVTEELLAIRDLQTFRPRAGSDADFGRLNAKSLKQAGKIQRLGSAMLLRVEMIVSAAITVILLLGGERVARGTISPGELVLFVSYATSLYKPLFRFARQSTRMGTTLAAARRLEKLMNREPAIVDAPDAVDVDHLAGRFELSEVGVRVGSRARGTRRWSLHDLAVTVPAGERVAVMGTNGAGKSSLLRVLVGLSRLKTGTVLLDGIPLDRYRIESVRSRMSVVFQDSVFFGLTVRENLVLGRVAATDEEIGEVLDRVGASDVVAALPDGLDTVIRKGGKLLSKGQRQRLAIARAILREGDVWLLDEPTTSLDAEGAETVVSALLEATRGRTTFWVTHDPRLSTRLDRTLILAEGALAFFGNHSEYPGTADTGTIAPHAVHSGG